MSFGDIFYNRSFQMGLLPIVLPADDLHALRKSVTEAAGKRPTVVNLEAQAVVGPDGATQRFEIDAMRRRTLLEGLDGIGVTMLRADAINAFEAADRTARPWVHSVTHPAAGRT